MLQWATIPILICAWPATARPGLWRLWLLAALVYLTAAATLPAALFQLQGSWPPSLMGRIGTDLTCGSRTVLWSNVVYLISQRPWVGWGPGELDYAHYATLYPGPRFCDILDNAHNLPLHLAVEFGLPLAASLCLAIGWLIVRLRPWSKCDADAQLAWGVLAAIALHSLVEYPLWYGPFQLATVIALWLLWKPVLPRHAKAAVGVASTIALALLLGAYRSYDTVSQAYKPAPQRRVDMRDQPIAAAGRPLLFRDQLEFAELSITPLTEASAPRLNPLAERMLHYSPEPKVIEKLIESSVILGFDDTASWHLKRYCAAFPKECKDWARR
jgi:O-antigen ligase